MITDNSPDKAPQRDSPVEEYVKNLINDKTVRVTAHARPDRLYFHDHQNGGGSYILQMDKNGYYISLIFFDDKHAMNVENRDYIKESYEILSNKAQKE